MAIFDILVEEKELGSSSSTTITEGRKEESSKLKETAEITKIQLNSLQH